MITSVLRFNREPVKTDGGGGIEGILELTHDLKTDCNLTEQDQLRLENSFWMMHIAYAERKQRHGRPPPYWADPAQERHRDDNGSRASP